VVVRKRREIEKGVEKVGECQSQTEGKPKARAAAKEEAAAAAAAAVVVVV